MARDIYLNRMQQRIYYASARDVRLLAARRFGKTDGSIAPRIYLVSMSMARGTNLWLGNSRKQLYSRTVPGTISALERLYHLVEGVHFGWGKPPKGVPAPVIKPKSWENVIWFANGTIWQMISLAVTGSANSLTVNSIIGDECKFMQKAKIDGEVMPTLSGITHPLGDPSFSRDNPLYKSTFFASDASLTSKGNWLEKEEEKLDLTIEEGPYAGHTYREIQEALDGYAEKCIFWNELLRSAKMEKKQIQVVREEKKKEILALADAVMAHEGQFRILPKWGNKDINKATCDYLVNYKLIDADTAELLYCHKYLITPMQHIELTRIRNSKKYANTVRALRCNAFTFYRANTLHNIDILGSDYIARMKRDLPPLVFQISILNEKVRKASDGFYFNLDPDVHCYQDEGKDPLSKTVVKKATGVVNGQKVTNEYEAPDFARMGGMKDCSMDADLEDDADLFIALDYNAKINWVVTGFESRKHGANTLCVHSSLFVKDNEQLRSLMAKWDHYYAPHKARNRNVTYFYDHTAKQGNYAVENSVEFYQTVIDELRKRGWNVNAVYIGQAPHHETKYRAINDSLGGFSLPLVQFNQENNEALLVAMETAEVEIGYKGFRKNKKGEKLAAESADGSSENVVPLELRTDGTDAFDTLFWGFKFHRYSMSGVCMPCRR